MISKTDEYFLTIVKTGNLSKAAEQLFVSQPSLTKYIQRLEARLGAPLFDHSAGPWKLNEAGKLYQQYLLEAMANDRKLAVQISEVNHTERGTLRLGIPSYCGQCYLPKVLSEYCRRYPKVTIELHENTGDILEAALIDREIDLAVFHLPVFNEGLAYHPLVHERILMVVPRRPEEQPLPEDGPILIREGRLEDVVDAPVIMPREDQKLRKIVNDFFGSINYRPRVFTRTQNIATTLFLVEAGMGIGFVPESGLLSFSMAILDRIAFCFFGGILSNWQLVAVMRKGHDVNLFARRFVDVFHELYPYPSAEPMRL